MIKTITFFLWGILLLGTSILTAQERSLPTDTIVMTQHSLTANI